MIVMTLNCRGLASESKKLAICRLVSDQSVDVLFLQETMGDGVQFASNMELLLPGWNFCSVDAKGKSGGFASGLEEPHFTFREFLGNGFRIMCFSIFY